MENQSSASGSGPVTGSQSCSVEFVQYRMNGETQALEKVGEDYRLGPRRGGRIGPLALEQRKSTALVRDKGACKSCKKRKCKVSLNSHACVVAGDSPISSATSGYRATVASSPLDPPSSINVAVEGH